MEYSQLQHKGFEIAKRYENLPLQDRLNIIAKTFGCKTASLETSPCTGKYRGYSDILLVLDNGAHMGIGMHRTPQAKTARVINECVNNTLAQYNPISSVEDKFYVDKENQTVTWVYFNPDSEAGGQYVHNYFDFSVIKQALRETATVEGFFDYIGSVCRQELTDIDAADFVEADRAFKNDPYDFVDCTSETMGKLKTLANEIVVQLDNPTPEADYAMPDPAIGFSEMNLYGYKATDMLPLLKEKALELFDKDHTVYALYEDNTEAMVFDRSEILATGTSVFGIDREEWEASPEFKGMANTARSDEGRREAELLYSYGKSDGMFGIYS